MLTDKPDRQLYASSNTSP